MREDCYEKGNRFMFPLELTELTRDYYYSNKDYLYPGEVLPIQEIVEEFCDRMEYDGSLMYDEYPDKTSIERMVQKICQEKACQENKGIDDKWMNALVQVLLCSEISFRRERRCRHKKNLK